MKNKFVGDREILEKLILGFQCKLFKFENCKSAVSARVWQIGQGNDGGAYVGEVQAGDVEKEGGPCYARRRAERVRRWVGKIFVRFQNKNLWLMHFEIFTQKFTEFKIFKFY